MCILKFIYVYFEFMLLMYFVSSKDQCTPTVACLYAEACQKHAVSIIQSLG